MRNALFIAISIIFIAVPAAAGTVSGTVTFGGHRAQAFVAAVPIDTVARQPDADHAIVRMTGVNGTFTVPTPDGPFALVGWDGSNGTVVFEPGPRTDLVLVRQELPDAIAVAGQTTCTCRKWFWNLYWTCYVYWFGSDCTVTWGCAC